MDHKNTLKLWLGSAALACSLPAIAELNFSVEGGLRHEDNIGLAPVSNDEIDDITAKVSANLNWSLVQSAQTEISIGGGLYYDRVDDLSDLSRQGFTANAKYRGQANPDLTAFFWIADAEYRWLDYKDSDIRDGYEVKLSASVGKRFNELFTLLGGYRYDMRTSDDNSLERQPAPAANWNAEDVFDTDRDGPYVRGEFDLTPSTLLFVEYSRMSGDVVATGRSFSQGATFDRAWDYAFGPGFIAWKIDADQDIYDVGIKQAFSESFGVELSYSYLDASGDAGNDYKNQVFTLSANFAF